MLSFEEICVLGSEVYTYHLTYKKFYRKWVSINTGIFSHMNSKDLEILLFSHIFGLAAELKLPQLIGSGVLTKTNFPNNVCFRHFVFWKEVFSLQ